MDQVMFQEGFPFGNCVDCFKEFEETVLPNYPTCGHLVCYECYLTGIEDDDDLLKYRCRTCEEWTYKDVADVVNRNFKSNIEKCTKVFKDVKELRAKSKKDAKEILNLKKIIETKSNEIKAINEKHDLSHIGDVKCSECEKNENEKSVQYCYKCLIQNFGMTQNYFEHVRSGDAQFGSIAICAVCAIRNHMNKDHNVKDFYPLMRDFQFGNHSESLKAKRENSQQKHQKLKKAFQDLITIIDEGEANIDKMTELMGRSKTSALQTSLVKKIGQKIETNDTCFDKFCSVLMDFNKKMKNANNKLKDENNVEETANCDEE